MPQQLDVVTAIARVGAVAAALPEVDEQDAWIGVRWRVRHRTFAQVFDVVDGRPPGIGSVLRPVPAPGEVPLVLHVHAAVDDVVTFTHLGPPWFKTRWGPTSICVRLDDSTDWAEIAEVVVDSYRVRAPRFLARQVP